MKPADGHICTFFTFLSQLIFSLQFPFKWRKPNSYLLHSWSPWRQEHIEDVSGSETSSAADQNMLFCKLLIPLWSGIIIKTPWTLMRNCVLDIWTSLVWQWPCYLALVQVKVNVDVQGNNQDISLTWAARQRRVVRYEAMLHFLSKH